METYLGLYIIFSCSFIALRGLYLTWIDISTTGIGFVELVLWVLVFTILIILAPIFSFPVYVYDKVRWCS